MTDTNLPLVTVITVVFNDCRSIEKTLINVTNQTYPNLEYIIVDGGSKDGTLEIIKKYTSKTSKYISEPDNGIYDAMNKGVAMAMGEWVIFMNSGDWFYELTTVEDVFSNFDTTDAEIIYGNTLKRSVDKSRIDIPSKPSTFWRNLVVHQSIFSRRTLNLKYPFDLQFKVAADFDFIFKIFYFKHKAVYIDTIISSFDMTGFSKDNRYIGFREDRRIALKYSGNRMLGYIVFIYYVYVHSRGKGIDLIRHYSPSLFNSLKKLNK